MSGVPDGRPACVSSAVPVPELEDYDVSPRTGFLPEEPPLVKLEDPYFKPWEDVVSDLNALLLAGQLRQAVSELPLLDHSRLKNVRELRRAFVIFCMVGHGYVWGKGEPPCEVIPKQLAIPWHHVAEKLQLRPVTCQASVVLWNWRLLNARRETDLSNLAVLHTYTGSTDEAWFYLVTTAIEAAGAKALPACVAAQRASRTGDIHEATVALETIAKVIANLTEILKRMYDQCDPHVFYWHIRPYLAGWYNMAVAGLPHGVRYEGVPDVGADPGKPPAYRKYAGGSAAQSSLIQALDVTLGVEHRTTAQTEAGGSGVNSPLGRSPAAPHANSLGNGIRHNGNSENAGGVIHQLQNGYHGSTTAGGQGGSENGAAPRQGFISKMRDYMPGPHRRFLEHLSRAATLREFIQRIVKPMADDASCSETERAAARRLVEAYDDCLYQMKMFRDRHIQIVTLYIVIQARRGPSVGSARAAAQSNAAFEHIERTVTAVIPSSNGAAHPADDDTVTTVTTLESTVIPITHGSTADSQSEAQDSAVLSRRPSLRSSRSFSDLARLPGPSRRSSLSDSLVDKAGLAEAGLAALGDMPAGHAEPCNGSELEICEEPETAPLSPSASTIQYMEVTETDRSGHIKRHAVGLARQVAQDVEIVRGTGGTDLIPFLKQARDEVVQSMVSPNVRNSGSQRL